MVRRSATALCFLVILISSSPSSAQLEIEDVCENVHQWVSVSLPAGFLDLLCTVDESGDPVGIELSLSGETEEIVVNGQEAVESSDLPEEVKQDLLLLILVLLSLQ